MMQLHLTRILISALLYLAVSFGAIWLINPQSLVNFVGPCAALFSGLLLLWGITPLIAVLLMSPLLALGLSHYFHLDANLAVMTIAVLAITLQGYWTKQLVFHFIHYKKWLTSRKQLFLFLLRIGPIPSLVSACAVLVIAILDNQVITGAFFYTFMNTWSTSMLAAVFFIPLLLLVNNAERFKLTKRLFVSFTSILGGLAILLLLKTSQHEQQDYREALFKQSKVEIERLVLAEVDDVANKINSLAALFKASEDISLTEFTLFSEGILEKNSSVRALEWAPIVTFDDRVTFEQQSSSMLQKEFYIRERNESGIPIPALTRAEYAPLFYIYPHYTNQAALGLDVFSNPAHILSMQAVVKSKTAVASAPITLVQDELAKPGMLFLSLIHI